MITATNATARTTVKMTSHVITIAGHVKRLVKQQLKDEFTIQLNKQP